MSLHQMLLGRKLWNEQLDKRRHSCLFRSKTVMRVVGFHKTSHLRKILLWKRLTSFYRARRQLTGYCKLQGAWLDLAGVKFHCYLTSDTSFTEWLGILIRGSLWIRFYSFRRDLHLILFGKDTIEVFCFGEAFLIIFASELLFLPKANLSEEGRTFGLFMAAHFSYLR